MGKRGPQPIYGVAMTPAERQRRCRARRKEHIDSLERELGQQWWDQHMGQPGNSRLSAADRTKLAKILGMLGSAHEGERAAAAALASKMLADAGLTWFDLLGAGG